MRIYSSSFFHYASNLDAIKGIIKDGFKVFYCKEEIYSDNSREYIGIPMVSFCDIPLSCLDQINYGGGQIGIAMKRNWGISHELQPVLYYPNNKNCQSTKMIIEATKSFKSNNTYKSTYGILGYSKPMVKITKVKGVNANNYIEREWRKVYANYGVQKWLTLAEYNTYRSNKNLPKKQVGSPLKFGVDDIDFIIVPRKHIDEIVQYVLNMNFNRIGGKENVPINQNDKIMLISKIIAFESLKSNL